MVTMSPTKIPTSSPPPGSGCCSLNYKDCDASWCGATESECNSCNSEVYWLPNGAQIGCSAKWSECTNDVGSCCFPSVCVGDQWYKQCIDGETNPPPPPPITPSPTSPPPPIEPSTSTPTLLPTPCPTLAPFPAGSNTLFSTSTTRSSYDALLELEPITNIVQASNPPIYAIVAEGGAAGSGNVISEGQGYAIMIAGITLAAMDSSDPNRDDALIRFYGFFSGWKTMCQNSASKSFCQDHKLCSG